MLTTRSDAYISRFSDFCVHDDNDDDTTDHFTPAHVRGVTNNRILDCTFNKGYQKLEVPNV